MTESGRYQPDATQTEAPEVPVGLSSVFLPELGVKDPIHGLVPGTAADTQAQMNRFLTGLTAQGADIVSVVPVKVQPDHDPQSMSLPGGPVTRQLAIVRRQPGESVRSQTSDALRRTPHKP